MPFEAIHEIESPTALTPDRFSGFSRTRHAMRVKNKTETQAKPVVEIDRGRTAPTATQFIPANQAEGANRTSTPK
jgi:hypothetical protein